MHPQDRRYSKDHEWVATHGDQVVVGITDFAQRELGDIVYVELPQVGTRVQAGDVLGTVESVKAVSEIFAPIGGTVVDVNRALDGAPESLNSDPHGAGWYCKMKADDPAELDGLMDAAAYEATLGSSS
jgi:glycine cleavage system H protein